MANIERISRTVAQVEHEGQTGWFGVAVRQDLAAVHIPFTWTTLEENVTEHGINCDNGISYSVSNAANDLMAELRARRRRADWDSPAWATSMMDCYFGFADRDNRGQNLEELGMPPLDGDEA